MKLLILSNEKGYTPSRLYYEAKEKKWDVVYETYDNVKLSIETNSVNFQISNKNFMEFDTFILRGAGSQEMNFHELRMNIAMYFTSLADKKVLNGELLSKNGYFDKLTQAIRLASSGVSFLPSYYQGFFNENIGNEVIVPAVVKKFMGSLGKQVIFVKDEEKLNRVLKQQLPWRVLLQKALKSRFDYRVIVVGDKVIGIMKRVASPGSFHSNIAAGGKAESTYLSDEIKQLALKAASVFKADYCGVDIMEDIDGSLYVLEVNATAHTKAFESVTGVNVAREILDLLEAKGGK